MRDLMVLVERAVRPVRAGERRKLRMRDELLAHLTAVYEEEKARRGDDPAALAAAAERFGDPADLTRELQAAVPAGERAEYYFEQWFGWRATESSARYMARLAGRLAMVNLVLSGLIVAAVTAVNGWPADMGLRLRPAAAFFVVAHLDMFLLGWLSFQLRDAVRGASRSWPRAAGYAAAVGLVVLASGPALHAVVSPDLRTTLEAMFPNWLGVAAVAPLVAAATAVVGGPIRYRQTEWAMLDLGA
jgi:hypothetical protein